MSARIALAQRRQRFRYSTVLFDRDVNARDPLTRVLTSQDRQAHPAPLSATAESKLRMFR